MLTIAAQADDLFSAKLLLTCRTAGGDKLNTQKVKETDVIGAAVGSNDKNTVKNHALVYNSTANALQVVDSTGALVTNVMFFSGGAFTSGSSESAELTFIFLPDVGDAVGSAVITEKAAKNNSGTKKDKANITGNLQLYLVGDQTLGGSGTGTGGGGGDTNTNTTVTASGATANGTVFGSSGATNGPNGGALKWFMTNANGTVTTSTGGTVTTNADGTLTANTDNSTGGNGTANSGGNISRPGTAAASSTNSSTSGGTFFTLASLTQNNTNVRICTGKFTLANGSLAAPARIPTPRAPTVQFQLTSARHQTIRTMAVGPMAKETMTVRQTPPTARSSAEIVRTTDVVFLPSSSP